MRKMTVLGASALLVAGLMATPAAAFAAPIAAAPVASTPSGDATCPKEGKVDVGGEQETLVVTAPEGFLITGYCVKAGSVEQGLGPENVVVDPPATQVTIEHSSGKAISHYTLITVKAEPSPSPTPSVPGEDQTPVPSEPGDDQTPTPTVPGDDQSPVPSEPGTDVTEPADESAAPVEGGATPSASVEEPEVLAATGNSTAVGITLIALALVGGGVTLIVLRRKGVLGS
ncbi:hypothetical protein [Promicromonospora xylanilytica]